MGVPATRAASVAAAGRRLRGLVIGRNVWQRPPEVTGGLMRRLHAIVHPA